MFIISATEHSQKAMYTRKERASTLTPSTNADSHNYSSLVDRTREAALGIGAGISLTLACKNNCSLNGLQILRQLGDKDGLVSNMYPPHTARDFTDVAG